MSTELILLHAAVLQDDFTFRTCDVRIRQGKIAEIGSFTGEEGLNLSGRYLLPGLVESHFHGAVGEDFHEADREGIRKIAAYEAAHGITTIIPTISSSRDAVVEYSLRTVGEAIREGNTGGSAIRGIHLEGPFLSDARKGSHLTIYLHRPSIEELDRLDKLSGGNVRSMTIAPELEGAMDVIRYACSKKITIQIGHTAADYATTIKAIDAGATVATHTFNGMEPLHHRSPGVLGAVLTDDRVTCEMIGDLVHVQGPVLQLIYRAKGPERVSLVSDSMYGAGLPEGEYTRQGRTRTVQGGVARLPDGTISGSARTILDGVRNLVGLGIPLEQAVKAASYNPARTLGLAASIGSIAVSKEADFVIMDKALAVQATLVGGCFVYQYSDTK